MIYILILPIEFWHFFPNDRNINMNSLAPVSDGEINAIKSFSMDYEMYILYLDINSPLSQDFTNVQNYEVVQGF